MSLIRIECPWLWLVEVKTYRKQLLLSQPIINYCCFETLLTALANYMFSLDHQLSPAFETRTSHFCSCITMKISKFWTQEQIGPEKAHVISTFQLIDSQDESAVKTNTTLHGTKITLNPDKFQLSEYSLPFLPEKV